MSERACARTWTCQVRMRQDLVPALGPLAGHLRDIRVGASLRGMEARVEGEAQAEGDRVLFRAGQGGETFILGPLTAKVQWDPEASRAAEPTEVERSAYGRLRAGLRGGRDRVQVVGPVREVPGAGRRTLEVREYTAER